MRTAGILLAVCSVFFLARNFSLGAGDEIFFTMSLGLGLFNLAASWLPDREHRAVAFS